MLFNTIVAGRPDYFSTSDYFTRKDLALIPNRFLLYESTDTQQVRTAARQRDEDHWSRALPPKVTSAHNRHAACGPW